MQVVGKSKYPTSAADVNAARVDGEVLGLSRDDAQRREGNNGNLLAEHGCGGAGGRCTGKIRRQDLRLRGGGLTIFVWEVGWWSITIW